MSFIKYSLIASALFFFSHSSWAQKEEKDKKKKEDKIDERTLDLAKEVEDIVELIEINKLEGSLSKSLKLIDKEVGDLKALGYLHAAISYKSMLDIDLFHTTHYDENLYEEAIKNYYEYRDLVSKETHAQYSRAFEGGIRTMKEVLINFLLVDDHKSSKKLLKVFSKHDPENPVYALGNACVALSEGKDAFMYEDKFMKWNKENSNYTLTGTDLKVLAELTELYAFKLSQKGQSELAKKVCQQSVAIGVDSKAFNRYL